MGGIINPDIQPKLNYNGKFTRSPSNIKHENSTQQGAQLQDEIISDLEVISKKQKKMDKQVQKFKQLIEKCQKLLRNKQCQKVIPLLRSIIEENQYLDLFDFKGAGNNQSWNGMFKDGIIQWYEETITNGNRHQNPYDLLSICQCWLIQQKKEARSQQWYNQMIENNSTRYQLYFIKANFHYNTKNYIKAEYSYKASIDIQKFAKSYQYLAWIYSYWYDYDQLATIYCQRSLELNPDSITCQYIQAITQADKKDRYNTLTNLFIKEPRYYRIYINLGQNVGNKQKQQQFYRICLSVDDKYKLALFKIGEMSRCNQQYDQAQRIYNKVLEMDSKEDYTYFYLGILQEDLGNVDAALYEYSRCLEINPFNIDVCGAISELYKSIGENQKSIEFGIKQLQNNPYDFQTSNLIGLCYDQQQNTEKAIEYYMKSIEINANYYQSYLNLGSSYQQKRKFQEAKRYYFRAFELKQAQADVCYGLSICYGAENDYDTAIEWCLKCIQRGCDSQKQVYQYIGDLYKSKKQYQTSLRYYLKYSSEIKQIYYEYIMNNLIYQIDKSQALSIIQKLLEQESQDLYFYTVLGKILIYFEEQELSVIAYGKLKRLYSSMFTTNREIAEEIGKYEGSSNYIINNLKYGVRSYKDKLALAKDKKRFFQQFQQIFQKK